MYMYMYMYITSTVMYTQCTCTLYTMHTLTTNLKEFHVFCKPSTSQHTLKGVL